jgi:hypothetical protein
MVKKHITTCDNCQRNKTTNKKAYGKIPLTSALHDNHPWERIHIDCCGPWKINHENKETGGTSKFEIHLLSMVDACTGWSKFAQILSALSITTAKALDKNWLCRYPQPKTVIHDNGIEFMGCKFQEMLESYGIQSKPTTIKNPTAYVIIKCIQGTLGEQLRATIFAADWSDDINTLIQACAFAFVLHC